MPQNRTHLNVGDLSMYLSLDIMIHLSRDKNGVRKVENISQVYLNSNKEIFLKAYSTPNMPWWAQCATFLTTFLELVMLKILLHE